jgi:hypothetical protein
MKKSTGILFSFCLAITLLTFVSCDKSEKGYKVTGLLNGDITVTKQVNEVTAATTTEGDILSTAEVTTGSFTVNLPLTLSNSYLEPIKKGLEISSTKLSVSDSSALVTGAEFFALKSGTPVGTLENVSTSLISDTLTLLFIQELGQENYLYSNKRVSITGIDTTTMALAITYDEDESEDEIEIEMAIVYDIKLKAGWNKIYTTTKVMISLSTFQISGLLTINNVAPVGLQWTLQNEQNQVIVPGTFPQTNAARFSIPSRLKAK